MTSTFTIQPAGLGPVPKPLLDANSRVEAPAPTAGGAVIRDEVAISAAARARAEEDEGAARGPQELDAEEKQKVQELEKRDREVRAHEQAHVAALGGEGGAANFQYETGPDGRRYAVEGEVPVAIGEVPGKPRATIDKARRVARAAVAPARPSAADQRARARAQQVEAEARQKLAEERKAEAAGEEARGAPAAGQVGSAASAGLGLIESLSPLASSGPACGVCHPSRQGAAPAPSV